MNTVLYLNDKNIDKSEKNALKSIYLRHPSANLYSIYTIGIFFKSEENCMCIIYLLSHISARIVYFLYYE